jgi:hypothetical protein
MYLTVQMAALSEHYYRKCGIRGRIEAAAPAVTRRIAMKSPILRPSVMSSALGYCRHAQPKTAFPFHS